MSELTRKTPAWLRIVEIVFGAITIALSAAVIINPDVTSLFVVTLLGIALTFLGIARIMEGAVGYPKSKGSRAADIGIGAIAIVAGFLVFYNPFVAFMTLVSIINIFLLIFGLGLIISGITAKGQGRAYKLATAIIGGIVTVASLTLMAFPQITVALMFTFLSVALLIGGSASLVSGATGRRVGSNISK